MGAMGNSLFISAISALAETPEQIASDYRRQAAQAVGRLNQSLEKAATPLIAKLVAGGDTDGADKLATQLKAKLAVSAPLVTPAGVAVLTKVRPYLVVTFAK